MSDKQYVASLSYGKDSLAMLHVITDVLHWPLDRIITADVWATDTIPSELPPMVEFKEKADRIIKERWGIEVEHFSIGHSYEDEFYKKKGKGTHKGTIYGFPMQIHPWCNWHLKLPVLQKLSDIGKQGIAYIGIASDEIERASKAQDRQLLPLVEAKWTEQMCRNWCKENELLSPIYTTSSRGGCWFCHNQNIDQLRLLRKDYPDLWVLLMKWDNDSPVPFKSDGHTIHDIDKRLQWEDEGYKPTGKMFRWRETKEAQTNIFQYLDDDGNVDFKKMEVWHEAKNDG